MGPRAGTACAGLRFLLGLAWIVLGAAGLVACGGDQVAAGPSTEAPSDLSLDAPPPRSEDWGDGPEVQPVPAERSGAVTGPAALAAADDRPRAEGGRPPAIPPPAAEARAQMANRSRAGVGPDPELQAAVAAEIARARQVAEQRSKGRVKGADVVVAVHVRPLDRSEDLVAIRSRTALRPASNLKVLTAAGVLAQLGPDATWATAFDAAGEVSGNVLRGDLVVRADGDPWYDVDGDGSLDPWLDDLAEQLRAAGVRRVAGDLVLDEGDFLEPGPGPAWPSDREHWKEYCARSGGFSANAGCVTATVRPGPATGREATVLVRPRDHGLPPRIDVSTGRARSALNVAVEARPDRLVVRGRIPADVSTWSTRFAHPDPVELFGHAVVEGLARRGVAVDGELRRARGLPTGRTLATVRTPLAPALVPVLRDSNNSVADQLLWTLGHRSGCGGDRDGGERALREALGRLLGESDPDSAQDLEHLRVVDGSGLSREDRTTARTLTAALAATLRLGPKVDAAVRSALPRAGEDARLSSRMRDGAASGRVLAKTGFIAGTSGLTGVVEGPGGRDLVFAILVNYPSVDGLNTAAFKPMQDRICTLLAEHLWGER